MYDELIKKIRHCATDPMHCLSCAEDKDGRCFKRLMTQAADAIEKMSEAYDKLSLHMDDLASLMPRWIPVNERLPEENALCIVYNKDYGPMVGWRVDGERFRIPGSRFPDHPTHWMPLPEPPEEVLTGTDMRGGIRRDDAGNVIDWGITGPPGDAGKAEEGE